MIAFAILCSVFVLIALGQALRLRIAIWQIMAASAVLMIVVGQIGAVAALQAINWQVIVFLAGMFLLGEGLRHSGLIANFCIRLINFIPGSRVVLLVFMLVAGLLSALVTNDTVAIIATPVAMLLARHYGLRVRLPLLALALSVTLGSALSPLGNPQNLLVALDPALKSPFTDFLWWLGLPSLLSIGVAWGMLLLLFQRDFTYTPVGNSGPGLADTSSSEPVTSTKQLALLSRSGLLILVGLVAWRILSSLLGLGEGLPLWAIALCGAAPLVFAHGYRTAIFRGLDWQTLVFFAALFVSVQAVWNQGIIQQLIADLKLDLEQTGPLFVACLLFSQIVSNVPLVSLFLPILGQAGAGVQSYMVLASAATIAGNLTVLGAASNVIIIQQAQRANPTVQSFSFWDMLRIGIPLTAVSAALYFAWWAVLRDGH